MFLLLRLMPILVHLPVLNGGHLRPLFFAGTSTQSRAANFSSFDLVRISQVISSYGNICIILTLILCSMTTIIVMYTIAYGIGAAAR
jgi:hypothetical protein